MCDEGEMLSPVIVGSTYQVLHSPILRNTHFVAVWQNDETGELCPPPIEPCADCEKHPCECPPIPASNLVPSVNAPDAAYIDLDTEEITLPFAVKAFSVNDGVKWREGALPDLAKLLNKGLTLRVASDYNAATKRPAGTVISFPRIERRPKANPEKLRFHNAAPNWELRNRDGQAGSAAYIWANTTDKRTPSGSWSAWSGNLPLPASGVRQTVLVRTPASVTEASSTSPAVYTPGGKVFKVGVRG